MEIWRFVIKLPLIIANLALAYAVGRFASNQFNQKTGTTVFFVVLTWSFFIFIGAAWGQINTLSALVTFLAFSAMINQQTTKSGILLGIAVTLKISPLVVFPAFFAYVLKKRDRREAGKFTLWVFALPVLFTTTVFTVFQWNIVYFLKTIFYWTPVFESNAPQIQGGLMNIWSFASLLKADVSSLWYLRLVWVPILLVGFLYWLRRPRLEKWDLNLSIITLYLLFMISYAWVPEQSFVDPLPFLFLQVIAYTHKKSQLYFLAAIQVLVYAFSAVNYGGYVFQPLLERFSPSALAQLQILIPTPGSVPLEIRGTLGLVISLSLATLLVILIRTSSGKTEEYTETRADLISRPNLINENGKISKEAEPTFE
jgi:hypothetical protein